MFPVISFVTIGLLWTQTGSINYCKSKMCAYTNAHTLCQFASGKSKQCTGYINASLSEEEKMQILERMNRRRNEVASGKMRGWPSAMNMMKLRWVSELAKEAQLWADQCRRPKVPEENDACRDLYSVSVGQCVATVVGEAPGLKVASMVDIWFMQGLLYKGSVTGYQPPPSTKHYYGDFAQLLWSNSYMVGCGRSRFMHEIRGRLRSVDRLVCNMAPHGPSPSRPIWSPGDPAAQCPDMALVDEEFPALCNYQYQNDTRININNATIVEERILLNTVIELENHDSIGLDEMYLKKMAIAIVKDKSGTLDFKYIRNSANDDVIDDSNGIDEHKDKVLNRKVPYKAHKKLNLVGRPKSYNVEELSEIGGDHNKDNLDTSEEHKRKDIMFDTDEEYNAIDNDDERKDIPRSTTFQIDELTTSSHDKTTEKVFLIPEPITIKEIRTENIRVDLNMTFGNNGSATKRDTLNEDLTDPETVKELQAALDHMEREGEAIGRSLSGKVRRDIRDVPVESESENESNEIEESTESRDSRSVSEALLEKSEKSDVNASDRGPMLNMVMRYMPYLKKYEDNLIGTDAVPEKSSSDIVSFDVSVYLILLLGIL